MCSPPWSSGEEKLTVARRPGLMADCGLGLDRVKNDAIRESSDGWDASDLAGRLVTSSSRELKESPAVMTCCSFRMLARCLFLEVGEASKARRAQMR